MPKTSNISEINSSFDEVLKKENKTMEIPAKKPQGRKTGEENTVFICDPAEDD